MNQANILIGTKISTVHRQNSKKSRQSGDPLISSRRGILKSSNSHLAWEQKPVYSEQENKQFESFIKSLTKKPSYTLLSKYGKSLVPKSLLDDKGNLKQTRMPVVLPQ